MADSMQKLRSLRLALQHAGASVLDLSMINTDLAPHQVLRDRLLEATGKDGSHRYAVSRGVRKLREAFAAKYFSAFGVGLHPEEHICVTSGAKEGLCTLLAAWFPKGGRALLASPGYPAHEAACRMHGMAPYRFALPADGSEQTAIENFSRSLTLFEPHVVILSFPANPTGMTVSEGFWRSVQRLCADRQILLVHDFTYGELCHGETNIAPSALRAYAVPELSGVVELYSLSKAYHVPGWRVAAACGDRQVITAMAAYKAEIDFGVYLPIQQAASFALTTREPLAVQTAQQYRERAQVVIAELSERGISVTMPKAGACVWIQVGPHAAAIAYELLERHHVAVSPGDTFGDSELCAHSLRMALVRPEEDLKMAVRCLHDVLERRRGVAPQAAAAA